LQVDVIFTDFCKAFDCVDHHILQCVLQATSFGEPLLSWFRSFIDGRKQFVKIHGVSSDVLPISSGVPQGGHFSPLLFSIFLNSINHSLKHAQLLAFADDVKVFYRIDCLILKDKLNAIVAWVNKPGLDFNIAKCHHMTFTHLKSLIHFKYAINRTILQSFDKSITDLGFVLCSTLSPNLYIECVYCKSLKILGFIKCITTEFKLVSHIKALYCSLVRPIFEYGCHLGS